MKKMSWVWLRDLNTKWISWILPLLITLGAFKIWAIGDTPIYAGYTLNQYLAMIALLCWALFDLLKLK